MRLSYVLMIASIITTSIFAQSGIATKQHAMGTEVNLGTIVFEKYSQKMEYRNMRPQGIDMDQISRLSTEVAYGSCLSAQIADDIVKTYAGHSMSENDLNQIIDAKLPAEDRVFVWKSKNSQVTENQLLSTLAMKMRVDNFRRNRLIPGEAMYQAALRQAQEPVEIEAPSTLEEMREIVNRESLKYEHPNQVNALNVINSGEPNKAKIDRTGFLRGIFKQRFESTYFDIGNYDARRMAPTGAITGYQTLGAGMMITGMDSTLVYYTHGSIHAPANGDFEMSALKCMLSARGDSIRLVCPSSTGEIYSGGGEAGIYCGTKTTITHNSSGQFQILDPKLSN